MSTAFQPNAFQQDAFQIEGGVATNDVTVNLAFTLDGCSAALNVNVIPLFAESSGVGGYPGGEAAIIRYRRIVARRQQELEAAAKAKAEADEAQQRLNTANTKRQREKEARVLDKLRREEESARMLEAQLMVEIELLQREILGINEKQAAIQAEEEEFALMFALTTLI